MPIDRLRTFVGSVVVVVVCCRTRRRVQVNVEANQDSILGSVALSRVGCENTDTWRVAGRGKKKRNE